ncbi:MAG: MBL fold metallo-hydrolase, partial [Proteobacteria bacterium]|nr:MBL fold metallo-hydrolase [Pseudomonadota bacterium]
MKKFVMVFFLILVVPAFAGVQMVTPGVNPELEKFQDKLDDPQFISLGIDKRVNMVFGYEYSNWTILDGDDGLVIVDTGWFVERTRQAIQDFRKSHNNQKPIKAIIFTHMHSDHIGGIEGLFADGKVEGVDIYAHTDWQRQVGYDAKAGQMLVRRGMSQMGYLLPYKDLAKGSFGSGIGRAALKGGKLSASYTPNKTVDVTEGSVPVKANIAGIPIEFYYAPSDINAQLMVWLPEDRVVITGDAIGGTLPYVITPRHEPERKPESFLYTFKQILALDPENLIPGHGRSMQGRKDINAVVSSNYDVIEFLHDQVRSYINAGYSADQIIDELKLPPRLAGNPDLQPRYHTLDWLIRGLYANEAGWVQDVNSLTQHSASEQAKRMLKLVGTDKLLKATAAAITEKDYRWAISLAQMVVNADPDNMAARKLMAVALQGLAYTTESAGERNYALTEAGSAIGAFNWDQIFTLVTARVWAQRDAAATFELFTQRFKSEASYGHAFSIQFDVPGEGSYSFVVNNGTLHYQPAATSKPDSVIKMDLGTVRNLGSK